MARKSGQKCQLNYNFSNLAPIGAVAAQKRKAGRGDLKKEKLCS